MKIKSNLLEDKDKIYYWIEERWPGFPPNLSYRAQADILRRRKDALDYVEQAWEDGIVVMLFNLPDRGGFIQLVRVDSGEELNSYLKKNESYTCLSPDCRSVQRMIHWDAGKDAFLQMIARLRVRADYEKESRSQPDQKTLDSMALELREKGDMESLFGRLA